MKALVLTAAAATMALLACERSPGSAPSEPNARTDTSLPDGSVSSDSPGGSAVAPREPQSSDASTGDASSAVPSVDAVAVGKWEGHYVAKKSQIELPSNAGKPFKSDDGKAAVGNGVVRLTIAADGELTGTASGALGDQVIHGRSEGKIVRATVMPAHPEAPASMTGVLVGMVRDDVIAAQIRVAGPDASVVREAEFELKKAAKPVK